MGAPRDHAVSPWQLTAPDVVFLPGHIPLFAAGSQPALVHTKCVYFFIRAYLVVSAVRVRKAGQPDTGPDDAAGEQKEEAHRRTDQVFFYACSPARLSAAIIRP
jgi:hypothetical protein